MPRSNDAESILAEYLAGEDEPNIEELCLQHPNLAEELRAHWEGRKHIDLLMREALPTAQGSVFAARGRVKEAPREERVARAGDVIGDFLLVELLGRGGMGQVWEAEQRSLRRRVALKLVRPECVNDRTLALFAREARAGGRLAHPGITSVYGHGESSGVAWIAMELVPGAWTLRDAIDDQEAREKLPRGYYKQVAKFVADLADALQAAHASGVIHRDLKPQNILVAENDAPKLTDFGLARITDETALSMTGDLAGTYYYMSPEQVVAQRAGLDHRTDIFSLGVVLYEMLTFLRPFVGDTTHQVVEKILFETPVHPHVVRSRIPQELSWICEKAIEKSPKHRYSTMASLAEDLRRFGSNKPVLARPPSRLRQLRAFVAGHPVAASVLLVSALAFALISNLAVRLASESESLARSESSYRTELYASTIRESQLALINGDPEAAREALERSPVALRSWEWDTLQIDQDFSIASLSAEMTVERAAVSDDRGVLVLAGHGSEGPAVQVRELPSLQRIDELLPEGSVSWVAVSREGDRIALGLDSGSRLSVWSRRVEGGSLGTYAREALASVSALDGRGLSSEDSNPREGLTEIGWGHYRGEDLLLGGDGGSWVLLLDAKLGVTTAWSGQRGDYSLALPCASTVLVAPQQTTLSSLRGGSVSEVGVLSMEDGESRIAEGEYRPPVALAVSADATAFAGAGYGDVSIWDSDRLVWPATTIATAQSEVDALCLSADATLVAVGGEGVIRVWNARTSEPLCTHGPYASTIVGISFLGTGEELLCTLANGSVMRLPSLVSSSRLSLRLPDRLGGDEFQVRHLAADASGGRLAAAYADRALAVFDLGSGEVKRISRSGNRWGALLGLSARGAEGFLFTDTRGGLWTLEAPAWEPRRARELIGRTTVHATGIDRVAVALETPDRTGATVSVLDSRSLETLHEREQQQLVSALVFLDDARLLVADSEGSSIWDLSSGVEAPVDLPAWSLGAALPEGRGVALVHGESLGLYTPSLDGTGTLAVGGPTAALAVLSGDRLATSSDGGQVTLWDVNRYLPVLTLDDRAAGYSALGQSDGILISGGDGQEIVLHDANRTRGLQRAISISKRASAESVVDELYAQLVWPDRVAAEIQRTVPDEELREAQLAYARARQATSSYAMHVAGWSTALDPAATSRMLAGALEMARRARELNEGDVPEEDLAWHEAMALIRLQDYAGARAAIEPFAHLPMGKGFEVILRIQEGRPAAARQLAAESARIDFPSGIFRDMANEALETEVRSGSIWIVPPPQLEPPAADQKLIYISYRNISDAEVNLLPVLAEAATKDGWTIVSDPSKAAYRLRGSTRFWGEVEPGTGGVGIGKVMGAIAGAAAGRGTGLLIADAEDSSGWGIAGGGVAGGGESDISGEREVQASRTREWAMITDFVLEENVGTPLEFELSSETAASDGGRAQASATRTSTYYPHGLRISAWASKTNLRESEGLPFVLERVSKAAGLMLPK